MTVRSQIEQVRRGIPADVKLIAVSKFHPAEAVMEAYEAGQRLFGESRVQEIVSKKEVLPNDIEWHFIGSLQRNKVKQIAPFISLIHSLDSERLLMEIEKQGAANGRVIPCLLQIHIAEEETKSGFSSAECRLFLEEGKWRNCTHVCIAGVMGMATYTDDESHVRKEFRYLKSLFEEFKQDFFQVNTAFKEVSMGMTGDYPIAIEEGSSMVRIGTLIFGNR